MDEDLMPIEEHLAKSVRPTPGSCLEAGALLDLVEKGKRSRNYSARMAHVAICRECRESLKLLKEVDLARPKVPFFPLWAPKLSYGLAAAAVIAIVYFSWQGSHFKAGTLPHLGEPQIATKENPKFTPKIGVSVPPKLVQHPTFIPKSNPHRAHKRRPHEKISPVPEPPHAEPSIAMGKDLWANSGSTIEGEVENMQVIGGEVQPGNTLGGQVQDAPIVKGEVLPTKPPAP
jgi:hypothetical protein